MKMSFSLDKVAIVTGSKSLEKFLALTILECCGDSVNWLVVSKKLPKSIEKSSIKVQNSVIKSRNFSLHHIFRFIQQKGFKALWKKGVHAWRMQYRHRMAHLWWQRHINMAEKMFVMPLQEKLSFNPILHKKNLNEVWRELSNYQPTLLITTLNKVWHKIDLESLPIPILYLHPGAFPESPGKNGLEWALYHRQFEHICITLILRDEQGQLWQRRIYPALVIKESVAQHLARAWIAGIQAIQEFLEQYPSGNFWEKWDYSHDVIGQMKQNDFSSRELYWIYRDARAGWFQEQLQKRYDF